MKSYIIIKRILEECEKHELNELALNKIIDNQITVYRRLNDKLKSNTETFRMINYVNNYIRNLKKEYKELLKTNVESKLIKELTRSDSNDNSNNIKVLNKIFGFYKTISYN